MNKILTALAIAGFSWFGANAQTSCGTSAGKVCRMSADKKSSSCYKTPYAQNFKICKGDNGYFVCCEKPNPTNSTHYGFVAAKTYKMTSRTPAYEYDDVVAANTQPQQK